MDASPTFSLQLPLVLDKLNALALDQELRIIVTPLQDGPEPGPVNHEDFVSASAFRTARTDGIRAWCEKGKLRVCELAQGFQLHSSPAPVFNAVTLTGTVGHHMAFLHVAPITAARIELPKHLSKSG